jgi:molybdenum cofactor cytidylyltransferase
MARRCGFDQLIVTLGGAAEEVRREVSLDGAEAVVVDDPASGCAASLRVAVERVDPASAGIVLLLGDQPGVTEVTVRRLIEAGAGSMAVCRYDDGVGHPFGWRAACSGTGGPARRQGGVEAHRSAGSMCSRFRWTGRCPSTSTPGTTTNG